MERRKSLLPRLALWAWLLAATALPVLAQDPAQEPAEPPPPEIQEEVREEVEHLLPEEGPEPPPLPEGEAQPVGRIPVVAAVEIHSDSPLSRESRDELLRLLAFGVGDRLTEKSVARSLRNIQASGIASRIDVLSRPAVTPEETSAGDVVAQVVLRANLLVEDVRIEGDTGAVSRQDMMDALFQKVGEPLIETRLVRGVYELQELFEAEGYFEARVRLVPEVDEERRRATVVYRVEAGPRARVLTLGFEGEAGPFTTDQLKEPLRTTVGEPFRRIVVERDVERLEEWLLERGYRTALVDEPRVEYDPERDGVTVVFPLQVGPEVRVRVEGADVKKLRKRDLLPFVGEGSYDEALLLLAESRIRDYYQSQGHFKVEVDAREELDEGVLTVVVEIEPGPVYDLQEVRFQGNEAFSDDRLRELVATQPAGLLSNLPLVGGAGGLVEATLSADLENLRAFYALQGYVDAEIGPARFEEEGQDLRVVIPIEEGKQQRVVGLSIDGVEAFERAELRESMPLRQGGPFHPRLLDVSLNEIRSRYESQGYSAVHVSASTRWNREHTQVDVAIRVLEGPQTVVDRLLVRGNTETRSEVIRRAVGLERGEPISRARLLQAERDLYRLGIFSRAELELTPAPLGATTRDVVVRVEEGRVRSLRYGVSAEYNSDVDQLSYGGSFGITHANLWGRGITASLDARVLSREEQYRLFVEQPTVGDLEVPVSYSLFRTEEQRAAFEVVRRGGRVEARRQLSPRTRLGLAYDYRIVENELLEDVRLADEDEELERTDQTLQVSSLIPTWVLDHRNDPLNPSEGWNGLVQLQWAFPVLEAEADYLKLFLQYSHYVPLGFATLAASVRVGGIESLSPLPDDIRDPFIPARVDLPSKEIFLAERFFAGGDTSHRAYGRDELGIPFATCLGGGDEITADCAATLFPDADGNLRAAGGNGLALINVDLRFALFGPVEGVLFYDAGNLWADWRQISVSDFRSGVGVEARYASPVGPLRLGIGFPLDAYEGADDYSLFLSLGTPF